MLRMAGKAQGRSLSAEIRYRIFPPPQGISMAAVREYNQNQTGILLPRVTREEALADAAHCVEPIKSAARQIQEEEGMIPLPANWDSMSNSDKNTWLRKNRRRGAR